MKDLVRSSKQVLIVIPSKLCFDTVASALGLAHILADGRNVQIGSHEAIPKEFSQILDFKPFKTIRKLKDREVVLSLNRKQGGVKAVRWRESKEKIQFIITPEKGSFEFDDVDLETTGFEVDLVVLLGCESLESAGDFYTSNPTFFENVKTLNIDINPENSSYGTVNKVGKTQSLSSWIMYLAEEEGLKITREAMEALFKGIFWSSEGFRQEADLKKALKKLALSGGELTDTIPQLFNSLTVAEVRHMGKIISNMRMNTEGIIRVKIKHNEIQGIRLDRIIYPEINVVSRVKDAKLVMIISEYQKGNVLARIYSNDPKQNLAQLYSDFSPVGNSKRVVMDLKGDIDELEKDLMAKVGQEEEEKEEEEQVATKAEEKESNKNSKAKGTNNKTKEPLKPADSLPKPLDAPAPAPIPMQPIQPMQAPVSQMTPPPPIQPLPPAPVR